MNGGHVMNKVVCEIIKKVSAEYNVPEELLEEFYEIRDKERNINLNIEKTVAARAEMRELAEKLNKLEEKFKPYNLKFIYTWCEREDITNIPVLYEPATETKVIDIPSNEEINERAREVALENNFPELTGTPAKRTARKKVIILYITSLILSSGLRINRLLKRDMFAKLMEDAITS